ncbi:MAG: hypothetical protein ACLFPW_07575 [Spirochaetaceae bacterium]
MVIEKGALLVHIWWAMGKNSSSKGSGGRSKRGRRRGRKQQRAFDPEKHKLPDPVPEREYEPDPLTGEPVEDIYSAIAEPHSGKPANFESVLKRLEEQESLEEDERICYLGKGAFGIVAEEEDRGKTRLVVRKRIQYEDSHEDYRWRKELSPGISRDYKPEPEPLSNLYSSEEIASFPKFDRSSQVYMSRSS